MTAAVPSVSSPLPLREFVRRGVLLSDRLEPMRPSPLLEAIVRALEDGIRELYIVCPRRSGKSSAVAQLLAWQIMTRPNAFALAVAGSLDQCQDILEQKLRRPLHAMDLPEGSFGFARDRITCHDLGSTVSVVAASDATSPGRTVDLLVVDECRSVDEEAWEVLRPSAAGGLIVALGTPGPRSHWWFRACHDAGPRARVIHFSDAVPLNPTLDRGFVDAERVRLGKRGAWGEAMYRREWQAEWSELAEHPLLTTADVERCSVASGEIEPYSSLDSCFVGVDLSVTGDLTSIVTVARRGDLYRVLDVQVLDPRSFAGGTLSFDVVADRIEGVNRSFRPRKILMDQYQGVALAQRLSARGVHVEPLSVTAAANMESFSALIETINAGRIRWARHRRLESELLNLEIRETPSGWTVRDREARYHRDVSFSLALAVREAVRGVSTFRVWSLEDSPRLPDEPRSKEDVRRDVHRYLGRDRFESSVWCGYGY